METRYRFHQIQNNNGTPLPLPSAPVTAGFPSPADDYLEPPLDLYAKLVQNEDATIVLKVEGDSMIDIGISSGDYLIVDRSLEARSGNIVVAVVNGEFTMKRYLLGKDGPELVAENPKYKPIRFTEGDEASIIGVVTHAIKDFI